jgi:hypothetical protein
MAADLIGRTSGVYDLKNGARTVTLPKSTLNMARDGSGGRIRTADTRIMIPLL